MLLYNNTNHFATNKQILSLLYITTTKTIIYTNIKQYLNPHHLPHNPVRHLDCAYKHEHIKCEFPHIAPDHAHSRRIKIDGGWSGGKDGEYHAPEDDDRTFEAHSSVGFDEGYADGLGRLACE